mmetsp:Transcript_41871/g.61542  ORF Transcript_41871/g.61542 Transcript_41871/m.61542 type:complete len:252 (-) Transcript_41871:22-777(-)
MSDATWIISVICPSSACLRYTSPSVCADGTAAVALAISITMVGLKRLPCFLAKKCLAASERIGCSAATTSLILSVKGASSALTSTNGSSGHPAGKPPASLHGSSAGVPAGTGTSYSFFLRRSPGNPGKAPQRPSSSKGFCSSPTPCAFVRSSRSSRSAVELPDWARSPASCSLLPRVHIGATPLRTAQVRPIPHWLRPAACIVGEAGAKASAPPTAEARSGSIVMGDGILEIFGSTRCVSLQMFAPTHRLR